MTRIAPVFVLFSALSTSCSWSGSKPSGATHVARQNSTELPRQRERQLAKPLVKRPEPVPAEQQSPHEPLPLKKPEIVSRALAQRAGAILLDNRDQPLGTTIPFAESGHRYLARIEMHDNPENNPARPPGKHKGITVYER